MIMTQHIVTRWYRPPELMLHPDGLYSTAVDMWSVGCVFAELLSRKPFFPGKNFIHQLTLILDVIGCPLEEEISHIRSRQARKFLDKFIGKQRMPLSTYFPANTNPDAIDVIEKLLLFDPGKRISAREALLHPYFAPLQSLEDIRPDPPTIRDMDFQFEVEYDHYDCNVDKLRYFKNLMLKEVRKNDHDISDEGIESSINMVSPKESNYLQRQSTINDIDFENKENCDPCAVPVTKANLFNFHGRHIKSRIKESLSKNKPKSKECHGVNSYSTKKGNGGVGPRKITPDEKDRFRRRRSKPKTIPKSPNFSVMSWQRKIEFH